MTFKGPGYAADGFIDRKKARYDVTESRLGLVAVINDLHKGRDTGSVWADIIDISAALMVLVSLTGSDPDLLPAEAAEDRTGRRRHRHRGLHRRSISNFWVPQPRDDRGVIET